jgi:GAF domain-containing protein
MSFQSASAVGTSKASQYQALSENAAALLKGEHDAIANAANLSALIWQFLPGLNWAGFYFWKQDQLVLGPFQGKVACVRIAMGKGVCGRAAQERNTQIVADVHAFAGHIACDPDSRSEIVVPLLDRDRLIGVLDLDSPQLGRFDEEDRQGLESLAALWLKGSDI